jgi:uncharacterized protein (TIGR02145 family)
MKTRSSIVANLVVIALLLVIFKGCTDGNFLKDAPGPGGLPTRPEFSDTYVKSVTMTTAVCNASVLLWSGSSNMTDIGFCWSSLHIPTLQDSLTSVKNDFTSNGLFGNFTTTLSVLKANKQYTVRAFYTDNKGTVYGPAKNFTTLPEIPVVYTSFVFDFTCNSAISEGNVISEGKTIVSERGIYLKSSANPEINGTKFPIGRGSGSFSTNLKGLNQNTTYYVKAYASNSIGTGYGLQYSFNTGKDTSMPRISDIDGNIYHYVTIGTQVWMVENLKTTKYNDGINIPLVTDKTNWANLKTPGFCWYDNNDSEYKAAYGALYNWYSINTGKLCPAGWHVPTEAEWTMLKSVPVVRLKEFGSAHWIYPNAEATNETGFTALPGSMRVSDGTFNDGNYGIGKAGSWWTSSESSSTSAWSIQIDADNAGTTGDGVSPKNSGYSVRCIKN